MCIRDRIREADELLEKGDIVQASEKYYKAAEEAIKLLVKTLNLKDIIEKVKEEGYWSLGVLHDAVTEIAKRLSDEEIIDLWKSAIVILTVNLPKDVLVIEAEKVKRLVELSDKIANFRVD
ncbi:PaREP1 family protein [Sulfolobus acidocaldarius]|uniref:PaREP1 family protein n=1 Tax=Sulfolobus acidocaldarius TaxID=2285 RepID=UPI000784B336|nr:PaREP1 family protein [Sulfolobus acidocaldarius]